MCCTRRIDCDVLEGPIAGESNLSEQQNYEAGDHPNNDE
jgi:hypothetical protein